MINRTNDPLADRIEDIETKLRMLATSLTQAHRRLDEVTGRATPHPTVKPPEPPTYATALGMVEASGVAHGWPSTSLGAVLMRLSDISYADTPSNTDGLWARVAAIAQHESGQPIEPGRIDFGWKRTVWQVLASFAEGCAEDRPRAADWYTLAEDAFAALVQIVGERDRMSGYACCSHCVPSNPWHKTPHNKPCHCRQGSQEFAEADA